MPRFGAPIPQTRMSVRRMGMKTGPSPPARRGPTVSTHLAATDAMVRVCVSMRSREGHLI